MKSALLLVPFGCLLLVAPATVKGQDQPSGGASSESLARLLSEAERNNPQVRAAQARWNAARLVPSQVSTLPDPEVMVQHMSVGSPRPFAGYSNSEMANIALGVSQGIPYPGKLKLKGQVAEKESEVWGQQFESVKRAILAEVKARYFRLSYLAKRLGILRADMQLLVPIEESAEARYRQGMGSQQEVLQAQLEETRLLGEVATTELEFGRLQAQLKQLLNRPPVSPDIGVDTISETPLDYTYEQLLEAAQSNSPDLGAGLRMVDRQKLQVDLARKDFYPDFNVSYMWLRPDPSEFRARYEFSIGVRIPIFRSRKLEPALAQAKLDESRANSDLQAMTQGVASGLREQYVIATKTSELLKIYREGLLPQAHAELQAGLAAFQSGREDFQAVLASFLDVVKLDDEYWRTVSEHEDSVAKMEQITGLSLR